MIPAIPPLGIYPDETVILNDVCTSMFREALVTIVKTLKQPKCPSSDEWLKKMRCIYTMEYYSVIKMNKIMPFVVTWVQLEIKLSEVNQKRKTNTI